jgi:hypothetical protein
MLDGINVLYVDDELSLLETGRTSLSEANNSVLTYLHLLQPHSNIDVHASYYLNLHRIFRTIEHCDHLCRIYKTLEDNSSFGEYASDCHNLHRTFRTIGYHVQFYKIYKIEEDYPNLRGYIIRNLSFYNNLCTILTSISPHFPRININLMG